MDSISTVLIITPALEPIFITAYLYNLVDDASAHRYKLDTVYSHLTVLQLSLSQASQKFFRDHLTTQAMNPVASHNFDSVTQGVPKVVLAGMNETELRIGNTLPKLYDVYSTLQEVVKSCDLDFTIILSPVLKLNLGNGGGS